MERSTTMNGLGRRRGLMIKALAGLLVVGGVGGAVALWTVNTSRSESDRIVDDRYSVRRTSFDIVIPSSGELEALNSVEVRNRVEGRTVIRWIVEEGVRVRAGDVLVELASDDIRNRVDDESLRVESARSELVSAQESVELQKSQNRSAEDRAHLKVELAELELQRWLEGEVRTREKDLNLRIRNSQRNLELAHERLHSSEILKEEGFISETERVQDEIRLAEAKAEFDKAHLAFHTYWNFEHPKDDKSKRSDLDEARAELDRVIQNNARQLAQREADLINKDNQLDIRQRRLSQLQEQLINCTIRAPSDGMVVYATSLSSGRWGMRGGGDPLQIGHEVHNNQLLIILPDTNRMVAAVKVHETQASQISSGQPAVVRVDAMPNVRLDATVRSVGVIAESAGFGGQVREYSVRLLIDEENRWELRPSMRCKAEILLGTVEDVIAIPIQSVFVERGRAHVWMPEGGRWKRQSVRTGRNSETMIEIREGLSEGDIVLLREPRPGEIAG